MRFFSLSLLNFEAESYILPTLHVAHLYNALTFAQKSMTCGHNRRFAFTACGFLVDNSVERQANRHNESNNVMSACWYRILPVSIASS